VEARGGLERNASGEAVAFSGVSHDITEQVQAEEQRDTLQTAVQRREDMIAVVGHELRQPLAAMLEAVQAMAQPGDRSVTERACRTIDRQVRELIRIVEDLAQSSALQRGGVASSAAPLDLNDIVRRVAEAASSQTARRGISLAVQMHDAPVWVSGDAPQLQRVFANLMDNAVKYTKPGGRIDVAWRSEEHEAVVSIRDTGIGLDPEQLEWIFEPFARASTTERGLGVGLMVVRALVHLHGGTVHARSAGRGHGSEFVVHLPLAASREQLKD
jgi:signal transduction histidine kinase